MWHAMKLPHLTADIQHLASFAHQVLVLALGGARTGWTDPKL